MADGNFEQFPIPYRFAEDPNTKVPLTSTVNGLSLRNSILLKSAQFAEGITGEKMLAGLKYDIVKTW